MGLFSFLFQLVLERLTTLFQFVVSLAVFQFDFVLFVYNTVTPRLKVGRVVPKGCPGQNGQWPTFIAPVKGDSRCSCPALNAMANHGILPHSGRNISFVELNRKIRETFNFASTFCYFVPSFSAGLLNKSYSQGTFDLADLDLHNGIEHDASLVREDCAFTSDQSKPAVHLINALLACATGTSARGRKVLTAADLSRYSGYRRSDSRATNSQFSLSLFHRLFGSANASTLLEIFGGDVEDLKTILLEERLPVGWEPKVRSRQGLTMNAMNFTVSRIELGIREKRSPIEPELDTKSYETKA